MFTAENVELLPLCIMNFKGKVQSFPLGFPCDVKVKDISDTDHQKPPISRLSSYRLHFLFSAFRGVFSR